MKKIAMLGLVLLLGMSLAGCKDEEKAAESEAASPEEAEADQEDGKEADTLEIEDGSEKVFTLYTEDKSASIQIRMLAGYAESGYSSETSLAFQNLEGGNENVTQLNLRLVTDSEETIMTTAQQEVQDLLSANSDDGGVVDEVQEKIQGDKQWSYFYYSMEGLEGYRIWTSLDNGCVLSCTVENLGTGLEPLDVDYIIQELSSDIQS